ncbi:MAG TPA: histidine phosphatase family protein [Allosphingosinicella sp.]|nr:histidine phosphatase family protein [Allosphingosinicella sp.]
MTAAPRSFIARHGETVFNAAARMQGDVLHTPLTRQGFAQADEMGALLRVHLGPRPALDLWASPAGRALQTLAVIAEHLELDWHGARTDARLREIDIGAWSGRLYPELAAETGPLIDPATGLFSVRPPGGESYDEVALRLQSWLDDTAGEAADRLIVMHGMSSRVLRGLLTGAGRIAGNVPQGSLVEIKAGVETRLESGDAFDPF